MNNSKASNRALPPAPSRHSEGPRASLPSLPPPPAGAPAQSLSEFCQANANIGIRLNAELAGLRGRLFRDELPPTGEETKESSLQDLAARANYELGQALEQVQAIHQRL